MNITNKLINFNILYNFNLKTSNFILNILKNQLLIYRLYFNNLKLLFINIISKIIIKNKITLLTE